MSWELRLDPSAKKSLAHFPHKDMLRILAAIEELAYKPLSGDIQKIAGEKWGWRRRVGAYRILFDIYPVENAIRVHTVIRRTSKTY